MSSGQKAAFSFLAALILFAGFVFFAHTGLMANIETKFYAQAKIGEKKEQLDKLAQSCDSYISDILTTIQTGDNAYLKSSAVRTYAHQNPSEKDAADRKNLTARLFDDLEDYGFEGMRLIEKNGRTLHYSSYETDVLKRVSLSTTYKLYSDVVKDSGELDSEKLLVDSDKPQTRFLLDKNNNRMVISFPFYITDGTYFATLVCYFSVHGFEQSLFEKEIIRAGDTLVPVTADGDYEGGLVLNLPSDSRTEFYAPILTSWKKRSVNQNSAFEHILEKDDGSYWLLMTSREKGNFNISAVYSSSLFNLPVEMEYLIYICVFMTLLLASSLLFNLKRDYLTIIKSRIKKVQFGIINEYLENKEKIEWSQIARQLENRKAELSEEIKKTIGGKSKKYSKQVDAYLDSSWEDIIGILKAQNGGESSGIGGATIEEIRSVIEDVLRNSRLNVNVAGVAPASVTSAVPVEEAEAVEEIEEVGEAEPIEEAEAVEEIEEVEELGVPEPVEGLEEVEDAEPIEEAEAVEEIEEVEEAKDAQEPQDEEIVTLEEIEELPSADEIVKVEPPLFVSIENPDFYEDLCVGLPDSEKTEVPADENFDFAVEKPAFLISGIDEIEDAEELEPSPYFAMTGFAQNEQPVLELKGESDSEHAQNIDDTIIERDGIYSISENLPYTKVLLNNEFKALVDSVLQN